VKFRPFLAISVPIRAEFSALQTVWRSKRDSNPRSGFAALSLDMSVSCRLQNLPREFHAQTQDQSFAISPVSIRRPFGPESEHQAIPSQKVVILRTARQPDWVRMRLRA
jgi:hypothetical protein